MTAKEILNNVVDNSNSPEDDWLISEQDALQAMESYSQSQNKSLSDEIERLKGEVKKKTVLIEMSNDSLGAKSKRINDLCDRVFELEEENRKLAFDLTQLKMIRNGH